MQIDATTIEEKHDVHQAPRARKPKTGTRVAVIGVECTGCGGTPVCAVYCKRKALKLVRDESAYPFMVMTVDPSRCIGCGACVSSNGRQGIMLRGCPWNAIQIKTVEVKEKIDPVLPDRIDKRDREYVGA